MTVLALIGATALWLTYAWLLSAIVSSYLSHRKGYGERPGLASGLLLNVGGIVIWLIVPAKADSAWKRQGPWGRELKNPPPARAEDTGGAEPPPAATA
jgi:hypothetical protein